MKPKKVLLQEQVDATLQLDASLNRLEATLALVLQKVRKIDDWMIEDRGTLHLKLDGLRTQLVQHRAELLHKHETLEQLLEGVARHVGLKEDPRT